MRKKESISQSLHKQITKRHGRKKYNYHSQ